MFKRMRFSATIAVSEMEKKAESSNRATMTPSCVHRGKAFKRSVNSCRQKCGRGERIRTSGLYVPNVALYLAKLHPDSFQIGCNGVTRRSPYYSYCLRDGFLVATRFEKNLKP